MYQDNRIEMDVPAYGVVKVRRAGADFIIASPGKFEGECRYVPHMWDAAMDGGCDETAGGVISVPVEPRDVELFPELKRRRRVRLYQRDDGFVCQV